MAEYLTHICKAWVQLPVDKCGMQQRPAYLDYFVGHQNTLTHFLRRSRSTGELVHRGKVTGSWK